MSVTAGRVTSAGEHGFWMKVRGMEQLQQTLEALLDEDNLDSEMEAAIDDVLQEVLAEARTLCPYDESPTRPPARGIHLRDTGYSSVTHERGFIRGFVGFDKEYAIWVHENPDAVHPIGQWKFLEEPLMRAQPRLGDRIRYGVQRHIAAANRGGA